jgi:acyl carrier protein
MNKILDLVIKTVKEIGEDQENDALINASEDTLLFGVNLDSLGVVILVAELESQISDCLRVDLTLADERAMSQKTSPFKSVASLARYVSMLMQQANQD